MCVFPSQQSSFLPFLSPSSSLPSSSPTLPPHLFSVVVSFLFSTVSLLSCLSPSSVYSPPPLSLSLFFLLSFVFPVLLAFLLFLSILSSSFLPGFIHGSFCFSYPLFRPFTPLGRFPCCLPIFSRRLFPSLLVYSKSGRWFSELFIPVRYSAS